MSEQYKCDICGAPATVHLTQIVDGKIHKVHLCEKCAAKSKVAELPILKFTEMLAKTLIGGGKKAAEELASTEAVGREPGKVCPVCGMTDLVFEKKHLFGCAHCYEVFSEEMTELLPKIQRGRQYRGDAGTRTASKKTSAKKDAPAELEHLRLRLKDAVKNEDYALAAKLRDEMRALEKPKKNKRVPVGKENGKTPAKRNSVGSRARKSSPKGKKE